MNKRDQFETICNIFFHAEDKQQFVNHAYWQYPQLTVAQLDKLYDKLSDTIVTNAPDIVDHQIDQYLFERI